MRIDQFRETRAGELDVAAKILERTFSSDINTSPIYVAMGKLRNGSPLLKDGTTNANHWGYEIEDLIIPVDTTNHLKPKTVDNRKVELILNMKLVADYSLWNTMNDPLVDLNFQVIIRGLGGSGSHFFCFHIDRHDLSKTTNEPHPTYHLQYSNNPFKDTDFDYGSTFTLDTPRIIHYPVDFILGIGFLTSNFFPMAFDEIMNDGYFPGLYKRYQEAFLRPFFHSLSSYWEYDVSSILWNKNEISPSFLS